MESKSESYSDASEQSRQSRDEGTDKHVNCLNLKNYFGKKNIPATNFNY